MRGGLCIIVVLTLFLLSACGSQSLRGGTNDIHVIYDPSEEFQDHIDMLQGSEFEEAVAYINNAFADPPGIPVHFQTCGAVNAQWRPRDNEIAICYELMDYLDNNAVNLSMENAPKDFNKQAAVMFFFLHEMGHALIDVYDLPVTGREEDAVDQFAVIVLATNKADDALIASTLFFYDRMETVKHFPIWSKHALDEQRYYNILCWAYGMDEDRYEGAVTKGGLPDSRADRCGEEYAQAARSWRRLLLPYFEEGMAEQVQKKI